MNPPEVISKKRSKLIQRNKLKVRHRSRRRSLSGHHYMSSHESSLALALLRSIVRYRPPNVPKEVKIELAAKASEELEKETGTMDTIFSDWKISDCKQSLLLPCHKSNPSLLPWVFFEPLSNPDHHIFGDIEKRHSYCLKSPELSLELLHSKKGWLMFTSKFVGRNEETLNSADGKTKTTIINIGLVNPCSGTRLDLPPLALEGRQLNPQKKCQEEKSDCSYYRRKEYGAFTTTSNCKTEESRPDQVIYVSAIDEKLRIFLIRPGDPHWTSFIVESCFPTTIFLCGAKLYSFGTSKVTIFELVGGTWQHYDFLENKKSSGICNYKIFDCEGKVFIAGGSPMACALNSSILFYKLEICGDGKMVEWVELTDEELDGRIWFFGLHSFCVRVAGSGRKVCWFEFNPLNDEQGHTCHKLIEMHCCDINSGTELRLTRNYLLCDGPRKHWDDDPSPYWIDMNCYSDSKILLDKGITDHDLLPFPDHH